MTTNKRVVFRGVTHYSPHMISWFFIGEGILGHSDLDLGKKVGSLDLGGYSGTLGFGLRKKIWKFGFGGYSGTL